MLKIIWLFLDIRICIFKKQSSAIVAFVIFDCRKDDLKSMFSECGNVVRVSITPATRFVMPHLSQNTYG